MTWWHTESEHRPAPFDALKVGMKIGLDELEPHLAGRIDIMLEQGAMDEAVAAYGKCSAPGGSGLDRYRVRGAAGLFTR